MVRSTQLTGHSGTICVHTPLRTLYGLSVNPLLSSEDQVICWAKGSLCPLGSSWKSCSGFPGSSAIGWVVALGVLLLLLSLYHFVAPLGSMLARPSLPKTSLLSISFPGPPVKHMVRMLFSHFAMLLVVEAGECQWSWDSLLLTALLH